MALEYIDRSTSVPLDDGESVQIDPGQPWPSAYRGSEYSFVEDPDYKEIVVKWEHCDMAINTTPPKGLRTAMVLNGKKGGRGSFRVTADGEVLTKIHADSYEQVDQAPVDDGWIPVYLGGVDGKLSFTDIKMDPTYSANGIQVWPGLTFNHGERWTVTTDGTLAWPWRDYQFSSLFDHSELIDRYREYRPKSGRLYITEHGHVWTNIPKEDVPEDRAGEVAQAVTDWQKLAESDGNTSTLRMVNRRMVATSPDDNPANGMLPIHLGHLQDFDDGHIPRPVVDDVDYFVEVGQYENVWKT